MHKLFAVPVLIVIIIGAVITPAYAATKTTNTVTIKNEFDIDGTYCGITSNFHIVEFYNFRETIWNNGKFVNNVRGQITISDNNNNAHVAKGTSTQHLVGNLDPGPSNYQLNGKFICVHDGSTDGYHVGITVHRDGTITVHHDEPV